MRKAQLAVYMVVVLIALLAAGTTVYVLKQKKEADTPGLKAAARSDLAKYVQSCLEPAVLEGIEILRLQGGHIALPDDIPVFEYLDPNGHSVQMVNGRLKVVDDRIPVKVPFWVTAEKISVPSKAYMERSLERYVADELDACLDDFNFFREQAYEVRIDGDMEVAADLSGAAVVKVTYPVTLIRGAELISEREFAHKLEVNLERMQEFLELFAAGEFLEAFLETRTLEMISIYSGTDPDDLPPKIAVRTNFDCAMQTWKAPRVKAKLQDVITQNMRLIKVTNTDYEPIEAAKSQKLLDSMLIPLSDEGFSDIEANFLYYPDFGMDFDIYPKRGDDVMPHRAGNAGIPGIGNFCTLDYNFKYFVKYPVLLEVTMKESDRLDAVKKQVEYKKGFTFRAPFLVVIYGNQPRVFRPLTQYGIDQGAVDQYRQQAGITNSMETLFCDARNSGNITIIAADAETSTRLESGMVYYNCGSFENTCFAGNIVNGEFTGQLPQCENGMITIKNRDYADLTGLLSADADDKTVTYFLQKLREMKIEVRKISTKSLIDAYRNGASFSPEPLEVNESVQVNLKGLEQPNLVYPDVNTTRISAGSYVATLTLFGEVSMEIQNPNGTDTQKVRKANLGEAVVPFTINPGDMIGKEKIVLYVLFNRRISDIVDTDSLYSNGFTRGDGVIDVFYHNSQMMDYFEVLRQGLDANALTRVTIMPAQYAAMLRPRVE